MKLLVLQHANVEHPGYFRKLLMEDGHDFECIQLHKLEQIPPIDNFDGLWVLGGPMDVWEEKEFPWLVQEKKFIKECVVEKGVPYLGLCLGHQLLVEVIGGSVRKAKTPEIGVMSVSLTTDGSSGVFFDGLPETFKCLQWHSAEAQSIPANVQILASSKDCPVQAIKWGTRAHSVQFHLEIESDTVRMWADIPEYALALETALGPDGTLVLNEACRQEMLSFNKNAERIYINWMQTAAHV